MLTPSKPVKSCECGSPCGDCCGCTKESIGLGNVDNTSDLNKPLSTAMINALSGKVDLDTFTQLKNRVLALENSMPDITALEQRVEDAEADILTLQGNYDSLSQAIGNLTGTVNTLSGRVTGVTDALVTVNTRIDGVSDRVDDLEIADTNNVKLTGVSEQTVEGKLKANDPSAGATDKTLVTANWISQSGEGAPNNLMHLNGIEKVTSLKLFSKPAVGAIHEANSNNTNGWRKLLISNTFSASNEDQIMIFDIMDNTSSTGRYGRFRLVARNNHLRTLGLVCGNYPVTGVKASLDSNNQVIVWGFFYRTIAVVLYENHAGLNMISFVDSGTISIYNEPTTADYVEVITGA